MRSRIAAVAALVVLAYGCATTAPAPVVPDETLRGVASWYGEEFAGRTTANGEIFDPRLLTAAHRTLPFGTVLDITNPKTAQSVRVRVNDRGPYVGNRIIDLSYAAAQQIGLIEPGIGEVEIRVVKVGSGEREPPAPFDVTIAEAPQTAPIPAAGDPPPVAFPIPGQQQQPSTPAPAPAEPAVVDRVDVEVQRGDVLTRRQVSPDGKTLEDVPVAPGEAPTASGLDEQQRAARRAEARRSTATTGTTATAPKTRQYLVQVGAFAVEANAKALAERLTSIGHRAFIDRNDLFRVRIGPFATREQAVQARAALEANGVSAMIVSE
ncbi:MAG TPA: septal ring lytic transglycosylase RlpA family protein [Thermoanaerobaculia bacterium]|nr:septal ring lytic transglycosylase RlpA family protein [Thermoanaerobaculia bacterium]